VLSGLFCAFLAFSGTGCQDETTQWKRESQTIFEGPLTVGAGDFWKAQFTVDSTMRDVSATGEFRASGGSGNDVRVVVAEINQFDNWINDHPAEVLYKSGQTTYGSVELSSLPPGNYVLGFSNKFSVFSDKNVTGHVYLQYEKRQ
jgi:hypothetical protein